MNKKRSSNSSSSSSSNSISSSVQSSTQCIPQIKTSINKNSNKKRKAEVQNAETAPTKRTSIYRGVTKHRLTGRFEAHLWDRGTWSNQQKKKGRQVYLGAYNEEESAAHAYDLAALKYWGPATTLNFPVGLYQKEIEEMHSLTKEEYVASLKRKSSGFSRGVSKYRGVARHHHNGRWEARIGRIDGNKYLYLGTFGTQEEAAAAYDLAAIQHRGTSAVTNFDISTYAHILKQDHPHEHDTPPQTNDEKQNDEQQNHNPDEQGKQEEEMNVLPQTLECLNDMDLRKDGVMNFANEFEYEVEQPWSLCLNEEEFCKLNVSDNPHEKSGELASLFNEINNDLKNYMDIKYDGLSSVDNDIDDIDMFFNEPLYGKYELNQDGTVDDEFMQMADINQNYDLNQEMAPGKEYCTRDEASDLVEKEAKTKKNVISLPDGKGCSSDEASDLVEEKRNENATFLSSPSSSAASAYYMF